MSPRNRTYRTIDYILLGLISRQPMHGYDLYKELSRLEGVGMVWRIKQSLLYARLDRLEKDGMLDVQWVHGETRPDRKVYQLTQQGFGVLHQWTKTPVQRGREMRQDFLARLYFASTVSQETALDLLEKQRILCNEWLKELEQEYSLLDNTALYERLVLKFRILQTTAMLDWLKICHNQLINGDIK